MVIMVKVSNAKMLLEGRNTTLITMVKIFNKKKQMIQSVFVFKFCDFCDFGVCGVTRKAAILGFEHLFVHLVMWPWHPCLSCKWKICNICHETFYLKSTF